MNPAAHKRRMVRPVLALAAAGLLLFGPAAVFADQPATVADLLAGGGKRLTKDEIVKRFAGATIHGTAMGSPTAEFQLSYRSDGSASGDVTMPNGSLTVSGTWSANDKGQYCQDLTTSTGAKVQGCFYYFAMGDGLFAAKTDGKSEPVYERQLTR